MVQVCQRFSHEFSTGDDMVLKAGCDRFWATEHRYALDAADIRLGGIRSRPKSALGKEETRQRKRKDKGKENVTATDLDEGDNHDHEQQDPGFEQYLNVLSDAENVEVEHVNDEGASTGLTASDGSVLQDGNHGQEELQEDSNNDPEDAKSDAAEVLDLSSDEEVPQKWASQMLLVIDPFIRTKVRRRLLHI
jgi:hypothetical protein